MDVRSLTCADILVRAVHTHEGGSGTNKSAQALTRRGSFPVLHPVPPGGRTQGLRIRSQTIRVRVLACVCKRWRNLRQMALSFFFRISVTQGEEERGKDQEVRRTNSPKIKPSKSNSFLKSRFIKSSHSVLELINGPQKPTSRLLNEEGTFST